MHTQERYLARVFFKIKVLASDGSAYETLFTQVMNYAHTGFVQIKPQGVIGDRKNDGYEPARGHYYQVYAPENPDHKVTKAAAAKKAAGDFQGLHEHWHKTHPIKRFSFVFNDKYKGSFPEIEEAIAAIDKKHNLDACSTFLSSHLEDTLFGLADDQILAIVGNIPDPENIQHLDYSLLTEVIEAVRTADQEIIPESALSAPDFEKKIEFNGISESPAAMLRVANFQSGTLDGYFKLNSTFAKQELRDELNRLYIAAKSSQVDADVAGDVAPADLVFFSLLDRITPRNTRSVQDAALVLLAYFFESCDVFEDPANGTERNATT